MKIVCWQSTLTEHQAYTFIALQSFAGEPIEFVVSELEIEVRKSQGWTAFDFGELSVHDLGGRGWWSRGVALINRYPDAIHLFNGMWSNGRFFLLLLYAQTKSARIGLITEPYADKFVSYFDERPNCVDKIKQWVRPLAYRILGGLLSRRIGMVFAISKKAVSQFKTLGFSYDQVFPYGYFVPPALVPPSDDIDSPRTKTLKLVFVGSLIARKGLSSLLQAIQSCRDQGCDVALDIFGPGDPSAYHGDISGIEFRGAIPFGKVQSMVHQYDALILPSLHDGWGVVVNEALLQGVPVLVSSECGSKALVMSSGAGEVFIANDWVGIAKLITKICKSPDLLLKWRSAAADYRETLFPSVAGNYLYQCLLYSMTGAGAKPEAPWYIDAEKLNGY